METVVIRLDENSRCYQNWETKGLVIFKGTFPSAIYYRKAPDEVFCELNMAQFSGSGVNFMLTTFILQSNTRGQMFCNPEFVVWSDEVNFKDKVFYRTRCPESIDAVPFPK